MNNELMADSCAVNNCVVDSCAVNNITTTNIILRPYQQECVDIINNTADGSHLIVLATALGKTVIFSHIERHGRVLILSHREELVHQPAKYYNCSFGVERAEESSNGEEVISASVQTLIHRLEKFSPDDFDTIITDEAHHAVAPSYRKIYDYFQPRLHLGFTATPNRADKTGLNQIFDDIIFERNIKWGIKNNYLSPIECRRVDVGYNLSDVHIRLGDFAINELENAIDVTTCNEAVAEVYKKYAKGPTLIFAASVAHAENISSLIPGSAVITATTADRNQILNKFLSGELKCIVNCMVLTEGTDLPNVETVIMARPTKNVSLYTQAVGRGTRLSPGKEKLNLIDCVGASSLNICAAPTLFGINPEVAVSTGQAEGDLLTMEDRIEEEQNRRMFENGFWELNDYLIDLFTDYGEKYDTHNINYTVMGNKDLLCSLGKGVFYRIIAEDVLGNTRIYFSNGKKIMATKSIPMQEALDKMEAILNQDYNDQRQLWDKDIVERWAHKYISAKQADMINELYTKEELLNSNIDSIYTLNRYQASLLIGRKMSEKSFRKRNM